MAGVVVRHQTTLGNSREEEREQALAWQDLATQIEAALPKTVRERDLALQSWLRNGGYVSWRPRTLELIVDGMEIRGSNLLDLIGHVMRQRCTQPLMHRLPGPPPGFAKFAIALGYANASRELGRNRWHWPQIYSDADARNRWHWPQMYSDADAFEHACPYDDDDDDREDGREKSAAGVSSDDEETGKEEAKAILNGTVMPEGGSDDDDSGEEGEDAYKKPARSDGKPDQDPFAWWETGL